MEQWRISADFRPPTSPCLFALLYSARSLLFLGCLRSYCLWSWLTTLCGVFARFTPGTCAQITCNTWVRVHNFVRFICTSCLVSGNSPCVCDLWFPNPDPGCCRKLGRILVGLVLTSHYVLFCCCFVCACALLWEPSAQIYCCWYSCVYSVAYVPCKYCVNAS